MPQLEKHLLRKHKALSLGLWNPCKMLSPYLEVQVWEGQRQQGPWGLLPALSNQISEPEVQGGTL